MSKSKKKISWLSEVEEHNYLAAELYLNLLHSEERVAHMVKNLKRASVTQFKAKDISELLSSPCWA